MKSPSLPHFKEETKMQNAKIATFPPALQILQALGKIIISNESITHDAEGIACDVSEIIAASIGLLML